MKTNPKGKYALVTGGSSGMGLEYVRQLSALGYNVIIVALFQNETDPVKDEMKALYPQQDFVSIGMDLSQLDSAKNLYDMVCQLRPDAQIEVLINNAGILCARHFRNMSEVQIGKIILIHNYTLSLMCHYFVPDMVERGSGYILNVSSLAAWLPYPFISTYAATKAYTKVLTRALRTEYIKTGVKFCSIYFGAVDTNLYKLTPVQLKWAHGLGVMISARSAAKRALRMMFHGRTGYMPGFINKVAYVFCPILPNRLISWIERTVTEKWNFK